MPLHSREQRRKLLDHEGGQQKGNAEPGGIDREQHRALGHGGLGGGHGENRRQDRADAGGPAERKGKPHHVGAPQPDRFRRRQPSLAHQEADPRQPQEMQAHDDDDDAGEDRKLRRPGADQAADEGRAGTERDEHGGEAEHEHQRRAHHRALRGGRAFFVGDVLDGGAGQIDQIGRHQRQHAGRQEADKACENGCRDRNVVHQETFGEWRRILLACTKVTFQKFRRRRGHRTVWIERPGVTWLDAIRIVR